MRQACARQKEARAPDAADPSYAVPLHWPLQRAKHAEPDKRVPYIPTLCPPCELSPECLSCRAWHGRPTGVQAVTDLCCHEWARNTSLGERSQTCTNDGQQKPLARVSTRSRKRHGRSPEMCPEWDGASATVHMALRRKRHTGHLVMCVSESPRAISFNPCPWF